MEILHITNANFEKEVLNSDKPVLIDFWASWCGPCRMVLPIVEKLAVDFEGKAVIGKVNVDEESALAAQFRIMSIPTVVIIKGGKAVEQVIGARRYEDYAELIKKHL